MSRRLRRPARPRPGRLERHQRELVAVQGQTEAALAPLALAPVDLDVEAGEAGVDVDRHHGVARDHERRRRCLRAWPAACRRRRPCRRRAPGRRPPSSRRSSPARSPPPARRRRRARRARRRRRGRRPAGRRRGGRPRNRWPPSRRARPPGRWPARGATAPSRRRPSTLSSASAISSAATAVSAPRLPQATPRTGAPCGAAARSDASTVPSPPTATTRSPVLDHARRRDLAQASPVHRQLDHVDPMVGGPARERRQCSVYAARRMDDERYAPEHRLRDHAGTLARGVVPQVPACASPRAGACATPRTPPRARARR